MPASASPLAGELPALLWAALSPLGVPMQRASRPGGAKKLQTFGEAIDVEESSDQISSVSLSLFSLSVWFQACFQLARESATPETERSRSEGRQRYRESFKREGCCVFGEKEEK